MPQLVEEISEETTKQDKQPIKKRKLPFGHYKVGEFEIKPITQDEFSDGWKAVLPSIKSGNPIHHWSVTLAQLPPHLWCKRRIEYDGNKQNFKVIKDNIYYYSVNKTAHDANLILLYEELMKGELSDNKVIKELLSKLEVNEDSSKSNISGWLIIRAKKFLAGKSDKYITDMS